MNPRVLRPLRAVLRAVRRGGMALGRRWRIWLVAAALGALVSLLLATVAPTRWVSQGEFVYRPLILWEGHLLAASSLNDYYALRLTAPDRVERAVDQAGGPGADGSPPIVQALPVPGQSVVRLQVTAATPDQAERVARALLVDLRDEVAAQNRLREGRDRLVAEISYTSFASPADSGAVAALLRGALLGVALAGLLVGAFEWGRRGRLRRPVEVEQLIGAPTLAAIPWHRR